LLPPIPAPAFRMSSFLGGGDSSHHKHHHRDKSPARSVISTRPGGANVFVREKSPTRPHTHRSKSEPEGFFSRKKSRSRSRSPTGIAGFLGVGGSASRHRSRSPGGMGSVFGGGHHHSQSRSRARSPGGFGGLFGSGNERRNRSPQSDIRSFFGGGGKHYSSTSRYGRRPRDGLVQKIMTMIRRTWRDLKRYAKNNPVKMITLVLMPLLTSGILVKLLGSLGIKLPSSIASLVGGGGENRGPQGGGYYGSQGYGGSGGHQGGGGTGIGLKEVVGVAKMFM